MSKARQFFADFAKSVKVYPWTLAKLVKVSGGGNVQEYVDGTRSIGNANKLNNKTLSEVIKMLYPVGTILEFDRAMNMSTLFGGMWELYGIGRVTVGINTSDTDFNGAGKTGGSKEMQKHTHNGYTGSGKVSAGIMRVVGGESSTRNSSNHVAGVPANAVGYIDISKDDANFPGGNHYHAFETSEAGLGNSGNLQPYVVVYRYRKISD